MYEFIQSGELKAQAKRLLGFRLPLVLVIIINMILIARIPAPGQAQAKTDLSRHHAVADASGTPDGQPDMQWPAPDLAPPLPADDTTQSASLNDPSSTPVNAQLARDAGVDVMKLDAGHLVQPMQDAVQDPVDVPPDSTIATTGDASSTPPEAVSVDPFAAACENTVQLLAQHWQRAAQEALAQAESSGTRMLAHARWIAETWSTTSGAAEPSADDGGSPAEVTIPFQGLEVRNLVENGEAVRLLVDDRLCELYPGEAHQFAPARQWRIQYHRGGRFENVDQLVTPGHYHFVVTRQGWELMPSVPE